MKYAHKDDNSDIEEFFLSSRHKKFLTKKRIEDFEASYFAMCLLVPKNSFLEIWDFFDNKCNTPFIKKIGLLAKLFNVEKRLIIARLYDLIERKEINVDKRLLSKIKLYLYDLIEKKEININKRLLYKIKF